MPSPCKPWLCINPLILLVGRVGLEPTTSLHTPEHSSEAELLVLVDTVVILFSGYHKFMSFNFKSLFSARVMTVLLISS